MGNRRCISILLRLTESKRKSTWGKDVGVREGTHMFSDMWCVGKSVRMHRAAVKERLRGRQRTSGAREHLPFRWFPLGVLETMVVSCLFVTPKTSVAICWEGWLLRSSLPECPRLWCIGQLYRDTFGAEPCRWAHREGSTLISFERC